MTAAADFPHKILSRRKAERWIAEHNPHEPGSPQSNELIALFWDDQRWMRELRRTVDRTAAATGAAGGLLAGLVHVVVRVLS